MALEFLTEHYNDVQSPDLRFACVIIVWKSQRLLATEDTKYLASSPDLFRNEGDVTLVLESDRNLAEFPLDFQSQCSPKLDWALRSPLRITRKSGEILLFGDPGTGEQLLGTVTLEEWEDAVAKHFGDSRI